MSGTLTDKILDAHLVRGGPHPGDEVGIRADQVLLQDPLGTMAFLQFEAMGVRRVQAPLVVQYADHNVLQFDFRNTDDHRFLQTACRKYGAHYSKPGNGICHQVHLENFAVPGQTLVGCDSHTPHCGAVGMLALGAGGLDVAVAMGGGAYHFPRPRVARVLLRGRLRPWVSAKDAALELLRRYTVKGGVGKVFEYAGPALAHLTVPERATIANMGTELGLTTSVFPSDEVTRDFFARVNRPGDWRPLAPDPDAGYAETIELDLAAVEPLVACPSQPDNVVPVGAVAGTRVEQVMVGSCTNGSYTDLATFAQVLKGRRVHPDVTCVAFPGSRQALEALARDGLLADLIAAGAIVSEASCGACPGFGHVPASGSKSLRAFNRNFRGRSGLDDDQVYLCSPEVAAASAIRGAIADPRALGAAPPLLQPAGLPGDRREILPPAAEGKEAAAEVIKGPNIGPVPMGRPFGETEEGEVLIRVGDKISTDDIVPAGVQAIRFRSNVPALAAFVFARHDPQFAKRAAGKGGGFVVGGEMYGQGSSREHAAICPMFLGVRAVLAKSFARIHQANLANWGILPLEFADPSGYDAAAPGHILEIGGLGTALLAGEPLPVTNKTTGGRFLVRASLTPRQREMLKAGGALAHTAAQRQPSF
jgi:aconitate hydratase